MSILTINDTPRSAAGPFGSLVGGTLHRVVETYRLGGRSLALAPALVALAVLPELLQHVAEIRLGMFGSIESFRALANDPTRWAFGYAKVAGFLLASIGVARFWAVSGDWQLLLRPGWPAAGRILLSIVLAQVSAWALALLQGHGLPLDTALLVASFLIQTALTVYMVGALLGDRAATLRWSIGRGWPRALFIALLLAATFGPCQTLHMADHKLAIGAPTAVVWAAMIWDSLFVGLFAALVGSATYVGYRYGPDWRGWIDTPSAHR